MKEITMEYIEKVYKNEKNARKLKHRDVLIQIVKKRDELKEKMKPKIEKKEVI